VTYREFLGDVHRRVAFGLPVLVWEMEALWRSWGVFHF
jgi:hypothetical protein